VTTRKLKKSPAGALAKITPQAEIGREILKIARKEIDDEAKKAVVHLAAQIIKFRDDALHGEIHMRQVAEFYEKKLAALEAGEFELDRYSKSIKFNDPELRENR
jgi:hypothetical protein